MEDVTDLQTEHKDKISGRIIKNFEIEEAKKLLKDLVKKRIGKGFEDKDAEDDLHFLEEAAVRRRPAPAKNYGSSNLCRNEH